MSTSSNASAVAELPTASSAVAGVSNETRSAELGEACDGGVTTDTGNAGDAESEASTPIVSTPPGPANVGGSRRRLYMSADYGTSFNTVDVLFKGLLHFKIDKKTPSQNLRN